MADPTATGLALAYLRGLRGLKPSGAEQRLGLSRRLFARYETGEKPLSVEHLTGLAERLRFPAEAVDLLLFVHELLTAEPWAEPASPVALSVAEHRAIDRAVLAAAWTVTDRLRAALVQRRQKENATAERGTAAELLPSLATADRAERRELVAVFPEYRHWAVVEALCHESVRLAAHDPRQAREWAELALLAAEGTPGPAAWRAAVAAYAWAFLGNALRVANDFDGADAAFARSHELWAAGDGAAAWPLAGWRLLDLEASLRREQHRFAESAALLDRAAELSGGDDLAAARILLAKEHILEQSGDAAAALATLKAAAPRVAAAGDPGLLFAHRFKTANNLCHLERWAEAARLLPEVRERAIAQGQELQLLRVLWLETRIQAGEGRTAAAAAALEQVRSDLTARRLPYDAALASLDLAVLRLAEGRTAEVRELAAGMAWIFEAQKIRREALAALALFCEAARQEVATVELARRTRAELQRLGDSPASPPAGGPKGRA